MTTTTTTTIGRFEVTTNPTGSQGRTWGSFHWDFTIVSQSGAVHYGMFSSGAALSGEALARAVLQSFAMDAEAAWHGEGDLERQLEHLEGEGLGLGLVDGYRTAVGLVAMWPFLEELTVEEVDELEMLAYDDAHMED